MATQINYDEVLALYKVNPDGETVTIHYVLGKKS